MPAYWWLISLRADWVASALFILYAPVWSLVVVSMAALAGALAGGSSGRGPSR